MANDHPTNTAAAGKAADLVKDPSWREGGVSGAIAFLFISATTEWLGVLPPVPDGQMTEYTLAGGMVIGGIGRIIRVLWRAFNQPKEG